MSWHAVSSVPLPYLRQALTRSWRTEARTKRLASGLAAGTPDYFKVLEVPRTATSAELKSSFYCRAKKLHPDVNQHLDPEVARRKFQELSDAYATLSDESLRATHEIMLDLRSKGTFSVNSSQEQGSRKKQQRARREPEPDPSDWGDPWSGGWGPGGGYSYQGRGGGKAYAGKERGAGLWGSAYDSSRSVRKSGDTWLAAIEAEFNAALAHAYQGPRFDVEETGRMYPFDFEAEERAASGIHDHVLQIVSGRQLLGYVKEVRVPQLERWSSNNTAELDQLVRALALDRRRHQAKTPAMTSKEYERKSNHANREGRDRRTADQQRADDGGATLSTMGATSAQSTADEGDVAAGERSHRGPDDAGPSSPNQDPSQRPDADDNTADTGRQTSRNCNGGNTENEKIESEDSRTDSDDEKATVLEFVWMGRVIAASVARPVTEPSSTSNPKPRSRTRTSWPFERHYRAAETAAQKAHNSQEGERLTIYGDTNFWLSSPFDEEDSQQQENDGKSRTVTNGYLRQSDGFLREGTGSSSASGGATGPNDRTGRRTRAQQQQQQQQQKQQENDRYRTAIDAIEDGMIIAEVRGHGLEHKRRPHMSDIFGPADELTHKMASMWTPGVHHLTWMSANTGIIECRATRGWLPPSNLWYFDPRTETHDIGGWYIERLRHKGAFSARDGVAQEASTLDPAVPILIAAHRTLRREQRQASSAGTRMSRMIDTVREGVSMRGTKGGSGIPQSDTLWSDGIVGGWEEVRRRSADMLRRWQRRE